MTSHRIAALSIPITLGMGALIYLVSRTNDIYLNQAIALSGTRNLLQPFLSFVHMPHWMIYSLPDGLWMFSLTMIMLYIWNFKLTRQSFPWLLTSLCCGIGFELLQKFHYVFGTFDFLDLVTILIGIPCPYA